MSHAPFQKALPTKIHNGNGISNKESSYDFLSYAKLYHDDQLSVFPLAARSKVPAKGFMWKRYQKERPSIEDLCGWFGNGQINMAIVTGKVSDGLAVRDFDDEAAYQVWASEYTDLAEILPTVRTQRGFHVYAKSTVKTLKSRRFSDGELRFDGNYVVAAPSVHPDGARYTWTVLIGAYIPRQDIEKAGLSRAWLGHNQSNQSKQSNQEQTEQSRATSLFDPLVLEAIERTLPSHPGQRHKSLFGFVRILQGHFPSAKAMDCVEYARAWHNRALPFIGTKPFEDTLGEFLDGWKRVKFPKGEEPISVIYKRAINSPLPPEAELFDLKPVKLLIGLCYALQQESGDKPFYLGCKPAADLIQDGNFTTTAQRLRMLCDFGILEKVTEYSMEERKANEYRYRGLNR